MSNVSPIVPSPVSKVVRPGDAKTPASLARAQQVIRERQDAVDLSQAARTSEAPKEAPIRTDLVNSMRGAIASGAFDDRMTDERLSKSLPKLVQDLKSV